MAGSAVRSVKSYGGSYTPKHGRGGPSAPSAANNPARASNFIDYGFGGGGGGTIPGVRRSGMETQTWVLGKNGGAAPAPSRGITGAVSGGGGTSTNFASPDPNLSKLATMWQERLAQLRDPRYADASISRATGDIMDRAAGATDASMAGLAAQGRVGSGGQKAAHTSISEAAKRAAARAGTDIRLGHEGQVNNFLLSGQGIMEGPARLALAQQGLGLQQRALDLQDRDSVAGRDDARLAMILGLARQPGAGAYMPTF